MRNVWYANGHTTLFLALVTFERTELPNAWLAEVFQGAVGWMAALARDEDDVLDVFVSGLASESLRLVEVDRIMRIEDAEDAEEFDDYLSQNMRHWEIEKRWVVGTIHVYYGDGIA